MKLNIFKKPLVIFTCLSLFLYFSSLILILINLRNLPQEIIIRFDNLEGIKSFGNKTDIFGFLLLSLAILIVNFVLSEIFFYRERLLSFLFIIANFLISLLTLISIGVIISVN